MASLVRVGDNMVLVGGAAIYLFGAQTGADPFDGTRAGAEHEIGSVRFCWAPSGTFRMGSPAEEPERRADEGSVEVWISRGFRVGTYEVTQGQWAAVMGVFPREEDKGSGEDVPVYWVNWTEANEFSGG